jgi:hypothetical protein
LVGIFVIIKVLDTLVSLSSDLMVIENLRMMMIPRGKYRIANVTCVQRYEELEKESTGIYIHIYRWDQRNVRDPKNEHTF